MELKNRLKNTRTSRHMTQKDLSDAAGISQARLSAIELGKNKRPTCVTELANALGVCAVWLQTGEIIATNKKDRTDYLYKLISSLDESDRIREIAYLEKLLSDRASE